MRDTISYAIIGIGVLAAVVFVCVRYWPEERVETPEVLVEQIIEAPTVEQQVTAARQLVRHGTEARAEVDRVLVEYKADEPEVIVPLVQAAGKAKAWRSIPVLFKLMEHPDPQVRGKANAAVRKIIHADYFFRANDPEPKRKQALAMMRQAYERMKPELERLYEGQE